MCDGVADLDSPHSHLLSCHHPCPLYSHSFPRGQQAHSSLMARCILRKWPLGRTDRVGRRPVSPDEQ